MEEKKPSDKLNLTWHMWYIHDKQWVTRLFGYLKAIVEAGR